MDWGVYLRRNNKGTVMLSIYVDDIILYASSPELMKRSKQQILSKFSGTDEGEVRWYLGMRVTRDRKRRTIALEQGTYIESIVNKFLESDQKKQATTPVHPTALDEIMRPRVEDTDNKDDAPKPKRARQMTEGFPYREVIGSLMYIMTCTRPDIAYVTGLLSRYQLNPCEAHIEAAKRVLKYLMSTKDIRLMITAPAAADTSRIRGYCDADWAGDRSDRKSTTGFIYFAGDTPICWASNKQSSTALSSAESEYIALSEAIKTGKWLRMLNQELHHYSGVATENAVEIMEDNQSCQALANAKDNMPKAKHIELRYHFSREAISSGEIKLRYCPTKEMLADMLTKPLERIQFQENRRRLNLY
jgi:hypothetical protein